MVFLPPLCLLKEFEYHYSNQRIKRVYKGNIKEEVNEEGNPFKYKQFWEYLSSEKVVISIYDNKESIEYSITDRSIYSKYLMYD